MKIDAIIGHCLASVAAAERWRRRRRWWRWGRVREKLLIARRRIVATNINEPGVRFNWLPTRNTRHQGGCSYGWQWLVGYVYSIYVERERERERERWKHIDGGRGLPCLGGILPASGLNLQNGRWLEETKKQARTCWNNVLPDWMLYILYTMDRALTTGWRMFSLDELFVFQSRNVCLVLKFFRLKRRQVLVFSLEDRCKPKKVCHLKKKENSAMIDTFRKQPP